MIIAKIEAVGLMHLPYDPVHYLNALAPRSFARLLKAIEPDAREVKMNPAPGYAEQTHILPREPVRLRHGGLCRTVDVHATD